MRAVADLIDVTVAYDTRRVLGPLTIEIHPGEHWALVGANGSGKTTLLGILSAQRHPTSGQAFVLGERIGATDLRVLRRRIGVIGQAVSDLLPVQSSALEIVLTGKDALFAPWWTTFDDDDRSHARDLLEQFHCGHLVDQPFGRCSQGERQRILLARSLYSRHPFLLLDEPATGVDLPGREALVRGLESLARELPQLASVHVAHTLEELPSTVSHALLLRAGETIACGKVSSVFTDELLTACYGLSVRVRSHDGRYSATAIGSW